MFYKMKLYVSFNILFQFPTKCGPQPCEIQKAHFTIHQVKMTPAACCHACTAGIMYYTWPGSHGRPDRYVVRYLMTSILSTRHATHWPVLGGNGAGAAERGEQQLIPLRGRRLQQRGPQRAGPLRLHMNTSTARQLSATQVTSAAVQHISGLDLLVAEFERVYSFCCTPAFVGNRLTSNAANIMRKK